MSNILNNPAFLGNFITGDFQTFDEYHTLHILPQVGVYPEGTGRCFHSIMNNLVFKIMIAIGFLAATVTVYMMIANNVTLKFPDWSNPYYYLYGGEIALVVGGAIGIAVNESCKNRKLNVLLYRIFYNQVVRPQIQGDAEAR
jgi:hypothetical protein